MLRMLLIDVVNNSAREVDIREEEFLDDCYKLIGCRLIDIVSRKIGDKYYDIILDDEGLLEEDPIPSAIDGDGDAMLCGNLLICNTDGEGNEVSLTDDDVDNIADHLCSIDFSDPESGKVMFVYAPVVRADY